MQLYPMPGDLLAPAYPDGILSLDAVHEAGERICACRAANETGGEPDGINPSPAVHGAIFVRDSCILRHMSRDTPPISGPFGTASR